MNGIVLIDKTNILKTNKMRSNSCLPLSREVAKSKILTEGEFHIQTIIMEKIMKSYIFIGGEVDKSALDCAIPENALVIAADSGYDNAKTLGYAERCDFVVGDFDSTKEKAFCSRAKIIRANTEKDFSDTRLAIDTALLKVRSKSGNSSAASFEAE